MAISSRSFELNDADDTARLGASFGPALRPGDVILLEGPVGAGKTHFARALVQSILSDPEDVPSPTFTLVQSYETENGELWHTDLYRVNSAVEIDELGLEQAFEDAICLVEWPDRLGQMKPSRALTIKFEMNGDARIAHMTWIDSHWNEIMTTVFQNA